MHPSHGPPWACASSSRQSWDEQGFLEGLTWAFTRYLVTSGYAGSGPEGARTRGRVVSLRRVRILGVLTATAMLASLGITSQAQAQTVYQVAVGAFFQTSPGEEMMFLPDRIRVHQGDMLAFSSESFHTATFLTGGTDASDWLEDNASAIGDPFFIAEPDTDDGPAAAKFNLDVLGPTTPFCGAPGTPCDYDGSAVLNSGVPLAGPMDFNVTVNAGAGSAFWVVCLIHQNMRMRVNVVSPASATSDPAQIAAERDAQIAQDEDAALALHRRLKDRQSFHRNANGKKIWDAWAGFDTKRFALLDMYPNKLTIKKGNRVRWHFSQLVKENHTVSISRNQAIQQIVSQDFMFVCDPDGGGPGPDNPPELQDFPFCNDPSQLEIDAADMLFPPAGNTNWTGGSDLEHSGVLGATPLAQSDAPFTVKFKATTNRKGVPYICSIHPFMVGRVRVKAN